MPQLWTTSYRSDPAAVTALYAGLGIGRLYDMSEAFFTGEGGDSSRWNRVGAYDDREENIRENALTHGGDDSFISDVNFDGIIVIDWESIFGVLNAGRAADADEHDAIVADMLALIQYIKLQRPLARVTFWGYPTRGHATHADYYSDAADTLAVFAEMDVMATNFYMRDANMDMDEAQFSNMLNLHLAIANDVAWESDDPGRGNVGSTKEVLPYFNHRFFQVSQSPTLITEFDFQDLYNEVRDHTYLTHSIDGFVHWNTDRYNINEAWWNAALDGEGSAGDWDHPQHANWPIEENAWDRIRRVYGAEGFDFDTTDAEIDTYLEGRMPFVYRWMEALMSPLDTRAERASAASVCAPWRGTTVVPDGTIGASDRAFIAWSYPGLTYAAGGFSKAQKGSGYFAMSHAGLVTPGIAGM